RIKRAGLNGAAIEHSVSSGPKQLAMCRIGNRAALENSIYLAISRSKSGETIHAAQLPFAELAKSQDPAARKYDFAAMLQMPAARWRDPALLRVQTERGKAMTFA